MTSLVVDASVAAKWFLPEPGAEAALRLLNGRRRLIAPDLIHAELGNIAWKLHTREVLSAEEATEMIEHFLSMPLEIHETAPLLPQALQIAITTRRNVYDSLYLALAVEQNATVLTADQRWTNALKTTPLARFIRLLRER